MDSVSKLECIYYPNKHYEIISLILNQTDQGIQIFSNIF